MAKYFPARKGPIRFAVHAQGLWAGKVRYGIVEFNVPLDTV